MKYICKNNHGFELTGRLTRQILTADGEATLEIQVCPYCITEDISLDERPKEKITSVISVDLDKVDEKLQEGYIVEALYAKTATLVKKE